MTEMVQLQHQRCKFCGEFLEKGRVDKQFHNQNCRSGFWRMKRSAHEHADKIQAYLRDMEYLVNMGEDPEFVRDCLLDIAKTLEDICHHMPVGIYVEVTRYGVR